MIIFVFHSRIGWVFAVSMIRFENFFTGKIPGEWKRKRFNFKWI